MENKYKKLYFKQIKAGCSNYNCMKIFCRRSHNINVIENTSIMLSKYKGLFLCENISKIFEKRLDPGMYQNIGYWHLDLFFYYLGEVYEANSTIYGKKPMHDENRYYNRNSAKNFKSSECDNLIDKLDANNNAQLNMKHSFCKFFNKKKYNEDEVYIVTGIIQMLLQIFKKTPHYFIGLLSIRLFFMLNNGNNLEKSYYPILEDVFLNIKNLNCRFKNVFADKFSPCRLRGNHVSITDNKKPRCRCSKIKKETREINLNELNGEVSILNNTYSENNIKCFDCDNSICLERNKVICANGQYFTKIDLICSVEAVSNYLNSTLVTDIRENKKVENMLNIFEILYTINSDIQALGHKKFYLGNFCSRINISEEFKYYRTKSKTPLNYSFILPVHIKAELIKSENNDIMKGSLQDSFFRSLFEGHIEPYLFITVTRSNVYQESLGIFRDIKENEVKKQLRITFKGEEGVDSGGIRKEYFQLLSQDIKHDETLFTIKNNILWFSLNDCDLKFYESIGKILGIALYNNVVLSIPFPSVFFKKLLNQKTGLNDLKDIDPQLFSSLSNLKKMTKDDIESLDLTYTISYTASEDLILNYNLLQSNREEYVNGQDISKFTSLYADFLINKVIDNRFEALKNGFYYVIDESLLRHVDARELEKIMMGSNDFDINALKSTTTYSGYSKDTKIIRYFWEIFEGYSRKMKRKLLQFITGNDGIPVSGSASLKLVIMRNGCDTERLPSSQTCFNTFLLPEYNSKDKLEKKLTTALNMTAGFYLL